MREGAGAHRPQTPALVQVQFPTAEAGGWGLGLGQAHPQGQASGRTKSPGKALGQPELAGEPGVTEAPAARARVRGQFWREGRPVPVPSWVQGEGNTGVGTGDASPCSLPEAATAARRGGLGW